MRPGAREPSAAEQLALVLGATERLGTSLDHDVTLRQVVESALPALGDFGFFDVVVGDEVRRIARAHEDAALEAALSASRWQRSERTDVNLCALSTGRTGIHPAIDRAWLEDAATGPEHLDAMVALGFHSMLTVPVLDRDGAGAPIGALTLFFSRSPRKHSASLARIAEELAARASIAIAHARLHQGVRASEERLRIALAAGRMGHFEWDVKSGQVRWSPELEAMHGYPAGGFEGTFEAYRREIHPDDVAAVQASVERAIASARSHEVTYRIVRPDGSIRWVEGRGTVERDASGAPARLIGVCSDVTERIEAERERAATERRFRFLAEASDLLADARDEDATVGALARLLVPALADWATIDLLEEDGTLRRAAIAHDDPERLALARRFDAARPFRADDAFGPGRVIREDDARVAPVMEREHIDAVPYPEVREALVALGIRSALSVPVRARGRAVGAISLMQAQSGRRLEQADLELALELGRRLAVALEAARLYREAERARREADEAARRARFLAEASEAVSSSLDPDATLAKIARLIVPALADTAGVYVLEPGGALRQVAVAHRDPSKEALLWELHALVPLHVDQDRRLPRAVRTGTPVYEPDVPPPHDLAWSGSARGTELLSELPLRAYLALPLRARGQVLGAIALSNEDREIAPADRAVAEELARRVGTALDNAQLYREAQQASRLKDDFLATVSHELRTPMNAILGWATLLPARIGPDVPGRDAIMHALGVIERNARAQARLVEDVLDVARIVSGKLRVASRPFELEPVVRAAVEACATGAANKGVQLEVVAETDVGAGAIHGDPDRLQQVVWNLVSNAVKFTPRGGTVRIALAREGSSARIVVSDDGIGIAPELLPHVFERFRQADSSSTRQHGGLGLGLSIARHLVDLHGGTIEAASAGMGRGATFTVRLPVGVPAEEPRSERGVSARGAPADTAVAAGAEDPRDRDERARARRALEGVRVLVCDDEADARDLVTAVLESAGASVIALGSAADVVDVLPTASVDVLVCDVGMPGVDGYTLMTKLRALPPERGGRVPAVALTAFASPSDRMRALAAGFQQHVPKPLEPRELWLVIGSLLGRPIPPE